MQKMELIPKLSKRISKIKDKFDRVYFIYKLNKLINPFNARALFSNPNNYTLTIFHGNEETSLFLHKSFLNKHMLNEIHRQVIIKEQQEVNKNGTD